MSLQIRSVNETDRRCQFTDRPVRLALHKSLSVDDGSDPVGSDGGIEGHIDTDISDDAWSTARPTTMGHATKLCWVSLGCADSAQWLY